MLSIAETNGRIRKKNISVRHEHHEIDQGLLAPGLFLLAMRAGTMPPCLHNILAFQENNSLNFWFLAFYLASQISQSKQFLQIIK